MERALEDALRLEGVDFETDAMMMSDAHLESPGQEGVGGGGGGEIDMSVGMEFDHIREQDMMMETEAEEIELMHGGEMSFGEEYHIAGGDMPVLGGEEEVLSEVSNNTSGEADGGAQGPEGEDAPSTPLNELTLSSMLSAKARPMTHVTVTSQQPSERGRSAAVAGPREVAIAPKPSPVSIDRFAGRQLNIAPKPVTLLSSNKPTALMKKVTLSSMLQGSKTGTVIGQLGKQLVMVPAGSAAQPRLKLVQGSTPVHYIKTEPSDHQGQVRRVAAGGRPVLTKMVVQGVQGAAGGSGPAQTVLAKLVQTPGGGPARYYTIQQPAQLVGVSPTRPGGSGGSGPPVQLRVCSKPRAQQLFSLKTGAKLLPAPPSQGKKIVISATAGQSMVMRTSSASTPPSLVSTAPAPATPRQQALPARSGSSLLAPPVHSRTTQLHQINVPGKGVQYIRLVTAPAKATPAQPAAEPPRPASKTLLLTDAQGNLVQMSAEKVSQPPPLLMSAGATVGQAVPKPPLKPQQKLVRIAPVVPRPSQKPIVTLTSLQSRPTFRSAQSILAPISPPAPAPAPAPCPPGREDSERDLQALIAESIAPEESARRPQEATRDESDNDDYNVTEVPIEYDGQESSMDGEESGEATTDPYEGRRAPVTPARIPRGWSPEDAADVLAEMEPELLAQYASPKVESNGVDMGSRPRKACNCTKSQCLKLYCDCFANGEFCNRCNCNNCHNNLENEEQRQKAIRSCLERNPNAFRPKIGKAKTAQGPEPVRRHNKGCNCKRSGCLKNYCECYEAKIACTAICKCVGCRNVEDSVERSVRARDAGWPDALPALAALPSAYPAHPAYPAYRPCRPPALAKAKQPCSFMTTEVITAVCQCLLAAAGERPGEEAPRVRPVLEEFSRCLQDIIAASRQGVHSDPLLTKVQTRQSGAMRAALCVLVWLAAGAGQRGGASVDTWENGHA